MKSRLVRPFRSKFAALPVEVQKQAREAFRLFCDNPSHPGFKFKKISASREVWSVRVSRDYRALAVRDGEVLLWFWIGSHADYDRELKSHR